MFSLFGFTYPALLDIWLAAAQVQAAYCSPPQVYKFHCHKLEGDLLWPFHRHKFTSFTATRWRVIFFGLEGKGVRWDYVVLRKTPGKEATRWDYTVEMKGKRDGKAGTVKLKDEKDENTPKDEKMKMEEAWDYSVEINSHE